MRRALISDFGGVLTSPLLPAFLAVQAEDEIPLEALGRAMLPGKGEPALFRLERGEITEADFLAELGSAVAAVVGRPVSLERFGERIFAALEPNRELFAYYSELRDRGVRLALCTNNVREWEPRWRSMLPVDDIFEVVVDSAFVGMRKPEPGIYALTLERLGVSGEETVFVDDLEHNVEAARAFGMAGVVFGQTDEARADIEGALEG